ncbi:hypothetical protein FB451DRAFT_1563275 [Mycena latifolia]|nr:hypothetical protein FB451DRAFT_1563275 [Mycena latifolia]
MEEVSKKKKSCEATPTSANVGADVTSRLHNAGGRAIAHGRRPQVGIGGHATIGGLGPISRQWGAALDYILEVEIANGMITRASATQNSDILFAVKGAAASFGIVTEFVFMTHPEPTNAVIYSYKLQLGKHADLAPTFAAWQDIVAEPTLDRKLASEVVIFEFGMIISGTYFGTRDEYNALNFEQRLMQNATVRKKRYCVRVSVLDDWLGVVGNWRRWRRSSSLEESCSGPFYSKSLTFKATTLIPAVGIQALFEYFDTADKGTLVNLVHVEGGAVSDVAQNATAYAHRDAQFYMQTYAVGSLSNTTTAFVTGISDCRERHAGCAVRRVCGLRRLPDGQQEYWGTNLPRLQNIKAAIDPGDVFHNPQSVRPVAANSTQPSATTTGGAAAPSTGGAEGRGAWGYWISAVLVVAVGL